ncbi:MAG: universal stress protein [Thermodesulfobacteriota bacterium]
MAKYRKILVAFDGSASSRNALGAASRLAQTDKSWIKVLAVVPSYEGDLDLFGVSNIRETIDGPGQKILAEARRLADQYDVHVLTNLEQGEPYERIVTVAREENCDLIVVGRRGLSNIERELMGSVTARVIGHTERNVLVVPEGASLGFANILVATDGSDASRDAVELAIDIAGERGGKLKVVSVVYSNDEFLALAPEMVDELIGKARVVAEEVAAAAAARGVAAEAIVREGEPYRAITDLAREIGADLLVMGSHGRKGLNRLLMGSVTGRTIGYASCPVLVVH